MSIRKKKEKTNELYGGVPDKAEVFYSSGVVAPSAVCPLLVKSTTHLPLGVVASLFTGDRARQKAEAPLPAGREGYCR